MPNERVDADYLYYALSARREELKRLGMVGTRTPIVNKSVFSALRIALPDRAVQRRIAAILCVYDDLIENCERRISVLDEMARTVYHEWCLLHRFPGHDDRRIEPHAVPCGWTIRSLGELVDVETGKRPKGGAVGPEDGVPSVGAENVRGIGRHDFASEKYVPRAFFEGMRQGVVRDRDVAVYKDGAYIGRSTYFRDAFPHAEFCVNEHVFLLRARDARLPSNLLYLWLQQPETVQVIRSKNGNAAQPGINRPALQELAVVLPPAALAKRLADAVEPHLAAITSLAKRIDNLRRTRDLLLPRLLSGQLSIEDGA